jgi:hypothetical protein
VQCTSPEQEDRAEDKEVTVVSTKGKRRAIMRKKPIITRYVHGWISGVKLMSRIKEFPQYVLDRFQYDIPQSILDILPPTHLANPIALGIHAIHYLLMAPILAGHESGSVLRTASASKGRWDRFEDDQVRGRSMAGLWTVSLSASERR